MQLFTPDDLHHSDVIKVARLIFDREAPKPKQYIGWTEAEFSAVKRALAKSKEDSTAT